jgi:F-type H+-transporting ATPase subunit gamma
MVCEEGARRNAMENATDNADDLHNQLNIVYNKARQAEITSQINEIMAGRLADSSEE